MSRAPVRHVATVAAALLLLVLAGCGSGAGGTPVSRWLAQRTLYVAHRGGDADWPEGSAAAYAQATAWNRNLALEVPVWRTADGVWVVSEQPTTGRVFGTDLVIRRTAWPRLAVLRSLRGAQPLARLREDVLDRVPRNRVLFVDDKADAQVGPLLDLLDEYGGPARAVLKGYWQQTAVPAEAHRRGFLTWGYYYSSNLGQLAATQSRWDLLGLEWSAPPAAWTQLRATRKRILAHVVATPAQARAALTHGATGLMVSDVTAVVPH